MLTWSYPPEKSGLARAAREIAQSLTEAGHDVRVITLDRSSREHDGAVEVIGAAPGCLLDRLRWIAGAGHVFGSLAFARAVRAEHRRRAFDVIEATNWYAPGLFAGAGTLPLVTRNSTPVATSTPPGGSLRDRFDRSFAMMLERVAVRRSTGLISNTAAHGEKIAALYGVPPPGPDHAVIGLSLPPVIIERGANARTSKGERIELLFVGRNEARKGFDGLIAALPLLGTRPYRMTIVGVSKQELPPLGQDVAERLRCFHRVEEDHLYDLFEQAHIVVAPSRYESFGLVYQEAMMFGRAIVACAEDASARVFIGQTGAGLLAGRCDGPSIAKVLALLIDNPELRAKHACAARSASGLFTRETLAKQTLAVYRSAIGRSSAASSSGRPAPAAIPS